MDWLFPTNQHVYERLIRLTIGGILLAFSLYFGHLLLGLAALIPLITGALGSCPLYRVFGLSTCPLAAISRTKN